MTFDDIKEMQIGSKKVKEAWLNGMQVYPSAKRIMDSLVCWYDPGKQQCTNESMAANPVLADLSGNGHDITCYNFAWSGMSGIGGYKVNFNEFNVTDNSSVKEHTYNKLVVYNTEDVNTNFWDSFSNLAPGETYHIDSYKVRISGLSDGETINYRYYNLNDDNSISPINIFLRNGINTIPEINMTSITGIVNTYTTGFQYILSNIRNKQITIELLPEYPNALVSDGVDDYAQVTGLPLLTKEGGYTVIAKRKLLNFPFTKSQTLAMKGDKVTNNAQAFSFERYFDSDRPNISVSFGNVNAVSINNDDLISYQTSVSYNGKKIIKGDHIDDDILTIFGHKNRGSVLDYCSAAIYSIILFDRDLTEQEIEWVKKNMIESGGVLKTDWKRNPWHDWNRIIGSISSNRLVINGINKEHFFEVNEQIDFASNPIPSYKVKITGVRDDLFIYYGNHSNGKVIMKKDGIYILPELTQNYGGFYANKTFENENIVIQQLLS